MTGLESLARFYDGLGQPGHVLAGGLWIPETPQVLMAIPSCLPLRPGRREVRDLLWRTGKIAAIFACGHSTGVEGKAWYVRDRAYGLHSLQRQFRQQVVASRDKCSCRPMDWRELRRLALPVNLETQARRGAGHPWFVDDGHWALCCEAAAEVPGLEAMGCFVGGELAAYLITWMHEGICHGTHLIWSDRFRTVRPTHVLYYAMVRDRMARPEVVAVNVGREAIPAMASVDRFKAHAGFAGEPCRVGVALHPAVSWLMTQPAWRGLCRALRRRLGDRWSLLHNAGKFDAAAATRLPEGRRVG